MKYLLLILISFNAYAFKYKIEYANNKGWVNQEIEADSQVKLDKELKKFIRKSKILKGEWNKTELDSIASRQHEDAVEYYHPSNFKVVPSTQEELDAEALATQEHEDDKAERKALRLLKKLDKQPNETVAHWRKKVARILKYLIKRN